MYIYIYTHIHIYISQSFSSEQETLGSPPMTDADAARQDGPGRAAH